MKNYVIYYRVSTRRQEVSHLGLDAQRQIVLDYLKYKKDVHICNEFTDIESGKVNNRPELNKAIKVCQDVDAILLIAKLDRLSRSVSFISTLMESKVKFVACDIPDANNLTIHIFVSMAQFERERISERIKNALDAKRQREPDWKPGNPTNLTKEARLKSYQTIITNARNDVSVRHAWHYIQPLHEQGHTYQYIADQLNQENYRTRTGCMFHAQQVFNIVQRFQEQKDA